MHTTLLSTSQIPQVWMLGGAIPAHMKISQVMDMMMHVKIVTLNSQETIPNYGGLMHPTLFIKGILLVFSPFIMPLEMGFI